MNMSYLYHVRRTLSNSFYEEFCLKEQPIFMSKVTLERLNFKIMFAFDSSLSPSPSKAWQEKQPPLKVSL